MRFNHVAQLGCIVGIHRVKVHHLFIAKRFQTCLSHHTHKQYRRSCRLQSFARITQDHHAAAGHVFAAMVAHAFHYRIGTGVTYAKRSPALPRI
jgi:hypothetical protein